MKTSIVSFCILLIISCNSFKEKTLKTLDSFIVIKYDSSRFCLPINKEDITKIEISIDTIRRVRVDTTILLIVEFVDTLKKRTIINKREIDSIFSRIENNHGEFMKFGTRQKLYFYGKDSLMFTLFCNDSLIKYKGTVYRIN